MKRATDLAHLLMRQTVKTGDWTVDATIGNGHDTLFLANLVGRSGRVFGFDVQEKAVTETARRTGGLPQVRLVHSGHERLAEHLSENEPANGSENGEVRLAGVMFNLGYLPGGPRDITTRAETTIAGLKQALARLKTGGLVTLVLYPGHGGGAEEEAAVRFYVQGLGGDFAVSHCARLNAARPAPELLAIKRVSQDRAAPTPAGV
jgi:predicted methyltransferase